MFKALARKRTAALLAVALLGISAAAYAYWTTTGSGGGTADAGTTVAVTVNQTNGAITDLYPGGPAKDLSGDFDNPNDADAYIASVTAVVDSVSGAGTDSGIPACTAADFEITGTSNTPGSIPSGNGEGAWSGLAVSMKDTSTNQDNCKGATVHIDYTANAS